MAKKINITAQLNAATTDGILADAGQIFDAKKGKFQEQVNEEFENALEEAITSEDTDMVVESVEEGIVHNALRKTKQILTEAEKEQARENIGAVSEQTFENEAVRVKKQVFTSEQKYQARHNISAITAEEAEKIAQDKIIETSVSSPDKLQAVKELSSWLEENPDNAATMNEKISENYADIQRLYRGTGIDEYSQFSTGMDYAAGAVVLYDGVLFRFKVEHAKGEWDYNEVEEWSEKKEREEKLSELGSKLGYGDYIFKPSGGYVYLGYSTLVKPNENLRQFKNEDSVVILINENNATTFDLEYWDGTSSKKIANLVGLSEYCIKSFNSEYGNTIRFNVRGNSDSFVVKVLDSVTSKVYNNEKEIAIMSESISDFDNIVKLGDYIGLVDGLYHSKGIKDIFAKDIKFEEGFKYKISFIANADWYTLKVGDTILKYKNNTTPESVVEVDVVPSSFETLKVVLTVNVLEPSKNYVVLRKIKDFTERLDLLSNEISKIKGYNLLDNIEISSNGYVQWHNSVKSGEHVNIVCDDLTINTKLAFERCDQEGNYISKIGQISIPHGYIEFSNNEIEPIYFRIHTTGFVSTVNVKVNVNYDGYLETANESQTTREKDIVFANGSLTSTGFSTQPSTEKIVTISIPITREKKYMLLFPSGYIARIRTKNNDIYNTFYAYAPTVVQGGEDSVRIEFSKQDGTPIQVSTIEDIDAFKLIELSSKSELYDICVAASDSLEEDKRKADIICDGSNDTDILCAAFGSLTSCRICLYKGVYNINKIFTLPYNQKASIVYSTENTSKTICVEGQVYGRKASPVTIKMSNDLYELFEDGNYSMVLAPRNGHGFETGNLPSTIVSLKNITFKGGGYSKNHTILDLCSAKSSYIDFCNVYGYDYEDALVLQTTPEENCVGIRVGHGSNNGIQNAVKRTSVYCVGKGVSCCGEHYIFEDVLTHHCKIGFAFGDRVTRGVFEHPNIMIGCSIEGCYRYMLLTKNGIKEEKDYIYNIDGSGNVSKSTLICIGLSTEKRWDIPTEEIVDAEFQETKGVLEILKGAYRGRIEGDDIYAEEGSCMNVDITSYAR